jgi:hypothetical protein
MGIFFQVFIITIWLKGLTNQGYYAYLTYGDMCDIGYLGMGGFGKMITKAIKDVLFSTIIPFSPL